MSLKNFLPLRREVMDHWIYKDSEYLKVWIDILFRARFSEEPKKDIHDGSLYVLNQGEFLFSRPTWSSRLKINPNKLYKLIKLLEKEEMITKVGRVGKSGATIYLVNNYQKYNNNNNESTALTIENTSFDANYQQPINSQPTTKQQPTNNEATLKNKVNNAKKENNVFTPPTLSEIEDYILSKKYTVDPKYFYDYYQACEWKNKDGKKVKSWKGTIVTWNKRNIEKNPNQKPYAKKIKPVEEIDPSMIDFIPEDPNA